jgi:hypothetical protein
MNISKLNPFIDHWFTNGIVNIKLIFNFHFKTLIIVIFALFIK